MGSEIIDLLVRMNLAIAAGVLLVLVLRVPVRQWFGARVSYALWLIPLAAALMCFVPGRVETIVLDWSDSPMVSTGGGDEAVPLALPKSVWMWAWAFGALVSLSILTIRQARFTQSLGRLGAREDLGKRVCAAQSSDHGPAVVGVIRPVIVTPADFDARFDAEERRLVLAHEQAHLAHGDPWINAIALAMQCLNWFNPFVHIGARMLRIDQELACDAAVLAGAEGGRRRYAEAMLKTHISSAVPIGCAWPASDVASFKERIAMLKRNLPSRTQTLVGAAAIVIVTGAVAAVAWAAQPTRVVATYADHTSSPDTHDYVHPISASDEQLLGEELGNLHDLNIDLSGDGTIEMNGEVVRLRDLTPEQREELRQTLEEARAEVRATHEQMAAARQAIRDAMRDQQAGYRLSDDEMESIREALEEARLSQEEGRQARIEALADARESMREAQVELAAARIAMRDMPDVRDALREAEVEIAQAIQDARREGDTVRAEALESAAAAIDVQLARPSSIDNLDHLDDLDHVDPEHKD